MADLSQVPRETGGALSLEASQAMVWEEASATRHDYLADRTAACKAAIKLGRLVTYAQELRPSVKCQLMPEETSGGNNLVRVIRFEDGERWIARIQFYPIEDEDDLVRRKSEIDTMLVLREHSLPVPKVYGYDATDEKIGRSFILMEYLPGYALVDLRIAKQKAPERFPLLGDEYMTDNLLRSLADFQARMSSIRLPKVGSLTRDANGVLKARKFLGEGPWSSAASYVGESVIRGVWADVDEQIANTTGSGDDEQESITNSVIDFPASLRRIAATFETKADETFPLTHADFQVNNIIVDGEMNLVGIVDWDKSHTTPWEIVGLPNALFYKRKGLNNCLWVPPRDKRMQRFCVREEKYIRYVEEAEEKHGLDKRLSSCLKDDRCRYLATAILGYREEHPFHYDFVETLFATKG